MCIRDSFNPAWKNAVIDGVTWAGTGVYGQVRRSSDNAWIDTLQCAVVVKLNFSTETVTEFNKTEALTGSLISASPRAVLCSARSTNGIYIYSIGGLALVSSSAWTTEGWAYVNPWNDFNGYDSFSKVFMGWKGAPDSTYRTVDTDADYDDTDFVPSTAGGSNREGACQVNKQFDSAIKHWCVSSASFQGDPDGFCYSEDGITWTQHWDKVPDVFNLYDFAWRTWE